MKIKFIYALLMVVPLSIYSQTKEEREKIASFSNKEANALMAKELQEEEAARKVRLETYLANNPDMKKVSYESGKTELIDVLPNGELIYAKTHNAGAAVTARATALYSGGSLGLNIQGQGMIAGVWDGGIARTSHQEFMVNGLSKINVMDTGLIDEHPTHVSGTIAAEGINPLVRGVAFKSSINAYDWTSDMSEILTAAAGGLLVSNHSYGIGTLGSIWFYGAYDNRARQFDNITFNNPYYLPVVSAGNDRNENSPPGSTQLANKYGYDMIFGHGNAKNVVTVAAVGQVNSYVDETSVVMSNFSSWGPSDDGRIKPDISMKGVGVRSTLDSGDTDVGTMSGTSMSSPGVTGVLTLLQQYHNQLYSGYMRAATVKGLILHTADEAGYNPGPDYEFGWGLINAEKSAKLIRDKNLSTARSVIEEQILSNNATFTKSISASGTEPLKVSISWTDPSSPTSNTGVVDPATLYLVNDLDLKVTDAAGNIYYPWKLQGMSSAYSPASNTGANNVDNFERVDIPNPSGTYTITVTHKNSLVNNAQNFSLIVSSANLSTLNSNEVIKNPNEVSVYPNPVTDILNIANAAKGSKITVLDYAGRIVKQQVLQDSKLDVSALQVGSYMLIYSGVDGTAASYKFTKR